MSWFSNATGRQVIKGFKVGLEIELEGKSHDRLPVVPKGYSVVRDGSLRNGFELVSSKPMSYEDFVLSMSGLNNLFKTVRLHTTPRTSVHIHANVSDLTPQQMTSFLWLSVTMEPVILEFCSVLRQHNGYCLAIDKTTNLGKWWGQFIRAINGGDGYPSSPPKYSALGMHRIYDLGTLEFRMFPGCKDVHKLKWYVDIVRSIYDIAMTYTVDQLRDKKIQDGVLSLLTNVIVDNRKRVTLQRLAECLELGIRNANDIMRKRMSIDELRLWHKSLFPNQRKELAVGELVSLIRNDQDLNVSAYDPESVVIFCKRYDSYKLYQSCIAEGIDEVKAVRKSLTIFEQLNGVLL